MIEYFEGVLFLTSNRPGTIDAAFRSRIHLALSYPPLSATSRRQLWKTWLENSVSNEKLSWLEDDVFEEIVGTNVNGREVKNIMRVAHALATIEKRKIEAGDVLQALEAHRQFQLELEGGANNEESHPEVEGLGLRPCYETLLAFIFAFLWFLRSFLRIYLHIRL